MNEACTFEAAEAIVSRVTTPKDGVFAFLASRSKKSTRELSLPLEEVFRGVSAALEQMVSTVVETKTAEEYDAAVTQIFSKYAALTISLSQIAEAIVPKDAFERMTRESICELESDFRHKALAMYGSTVKEQAIFTIWTIRKIHDIIPRLRSGKILDESKQAEDKKCSEHFTVSSLLGYFALDCLNTAMSMNRAIYPEVMDRLVDGLRSMVNAYTWARRGLALRTPQLEEPMEDMSIELDEKAFLEAAQRSLPDANADDRWLNGA
jgi:hypothetical protein